MLALLHKVSMRDFLLVFASAFILVVSPVTYAQKTYTYVGANFDRVSPPYDTSMRITGSFTVLDELDITSSVQVVPLSYSFSDGVQNFDETNSEFSLNVAVDENGEFTFWNLEISNYPRTSDTDLSPRGWIVSESSYRDAVYYRPCNEAVAASEGICRELFVNVNAPSTGATRTWTASGPGLPDGANTVLHFEGPPFDDVSSTGEGISYSAGDRISGTVVIKGAVTARAHYTDVPHSDYGNDDILSFRFTDGINDFDENDVHVCTSSVSTRVAIQFDENSQVKTWAICGSTRNIDYSYKQEWGIISANSGTQVHSAAYYFCNEYDPRTDSCKSGEAQQTSANIYSPEGSWTVMPPQPPNLVENCTNGVDDDADGLIDAADPDCPPGLLVRCIHEPLWPDPDEQVVLRAEAIDAQGEPLEADNIEIHTGDPANPIATQAGGTDLEVTVTASGSTLSYGCQAGLGTEGFSSGTRTVDVGAPELPNKRAIPVIYNGKSEDKIDIVFIPEATRHGIGAGAWDTFQSDIYEVITQGVYGIPWFVKNQREINFWLGRDLGKVTPKDPNDSSKKCKKDKPQGFSKNYSFAEASGIIHDKDCRDNSALKYFSTKYINRLQADGSQYSRLQVVAHEIGHAAFSLSDEYIGAETLYFTIGDHPNLFPTNSGCRSAAEDRGYDPDGCRDLVADGASGFIAGGRWIFEPDYRIDAQPWTEVRDLMQQTGGEGECESSGDTPVPFACVYRYRVGISEAARMERKLEKCRAGRCGK